MSTSFQYVLLAVVGVVTGAAVHRLSNAIRGSITKHLLLRGLVETAAILPGVALMGFVLGQRGPSPNLFAFLPVGSAFFLPHVAVRVGAYRAGATRRVQREHALPFVHWFDLLQTSPDAAREFLTTYLAQNHRRRIDSLPQLQAACVTLQERHPGHARLPAALAALRAEIARLEKR